MKWVITSFFLLLVAANGFAQVRMNRLEGKWVATACEPMGEGFIRKITGLIVEFKGDSVKFSGPIVSKQTSDQFTLTGKKLKINGTLWGTVRTIDNTKFILISDKSRRTVFSRIQQSKDILGNIPFQFNQYIFYQKSDSINQRLYYFFNEENKKYYYSRENGEKYNNQNIGRWDVDGSLLFLEDGSSTHFMDPIVYEMRGIGKSLIKLYKLSYESKDASDNIFFLKTASAPKDTTLHNMVTSKQWVMSEIISYGTYQDEPLILDGTKTYWPKPNESLPSSYCDSSALPLQREKLKQLVYRFGKDGTFRLSLDSKLLANTAWKFSPDGRFIILNKGKNENDYIELLNVTIDTIEFGRKDFFSDTVGNQCFEYFFKARLK